MNTPMKALIVTALAAFALSSSAVADPASAPPAGTVAHTPGYDRPGLDNTQADGHEHVAYWTSWYDHRDIDMQVAADAHNGGDLQTKEILRYRAKHHRH